MGFQDGWKNKLELKIAMCIELSSEHMAINILDQLFFFSKKVITKEIISNPIDK